MSCKHSKYRSEPYAPAEAALSIIKSRENKYCHMSAIIRTCEECNADISKGKRVKLITVKEYMDEQ